MRPCLQLQSKASLSYANSLTVGIVRRGEYSIRRVSSVNTSATTGSNLSGRMNVLFWAVHGDFGGEKTSTGTSALYIIRPKLCASCVALNVATTSIGIWQRFTTVIQLVPMTGLFDRQN